MNADKYRIYNETRQSLVATDAEAADGTTGSAEARLFELTPGSGAALWISPFREISPACAHIPLDLVYVNSDGVVLDTVEFFPMNGPGARSAQAASVIALPADTVANGGTRPGDRLQISAAEQLKEQLEKPQNGTGQVHEAKAPIPKPENGDRQEKETDEADAKWMRITDVTRRKGYEAGEAKEVVEDPLDQGVNGRGDLLAIPSFEEIERLLRQLQETNGSVKQTAAAVDPDGGGVLESTAKKEEELADMPIASVEAEPPEKNQPQVDIVTELAAKEEEELAEMPIASVEAELPEKNQPQVDIVTELAAKKEEELAEMPIACVEAEPPEKKQPQVDIVTELTAKKEEELAEMPIASVDAEPLEKKQPQVDIVTELTAKKEEELAEMPIASVDVEPLEKKQPQVDIVAELTAKKEEELAEMPIVSVDAEPPEKNQPQVGIVTELAAKKEEELADMPRSAVAAELPAITQEEPADVARAGEHAEEKAVTAESELTRGTEAAETNSQIEGNPAETVANISRDGMSGDVPQRANSLSEKMKRHLQHLHGAAAKLLGARIAPPLAGAGAAKKEAVAAQVELTRGAMAAERSEDEDVTPARIALDAADEGTAGQGVQLTLFPSVELEQFFEIPQDAPMRQTAGADARPSAEISASLPAIEKPVVALNDAVRAETQAKKEPATSPTLSREMPTGGAKAEETGSTAIAPSVDRGAFSQPQPGGGAAAMEVVRPVDQSATAGCEERAVRVEHPKETDLHLTTTAQSIPQPEAGTSGHPDRTSAERASSTDGAASSSCEALSNSFAATLPRGKVPGVKPNAQREWAKRGVVPRNWIDHILLDDTLVRRWIQSLLLNDTPAKNWILRVLVGKNPNDNWIEDMLSTEVLDPRSGPRENVRGLIAYFFTGGPAVQSPVHDISTSGLYIVTTVRWYQGTIVRLTLTDQEKPTDEGSITVQGKVVRAGDDGVGFELLLEGSRAHHGRFERYVPTQGVHVTHLREFVQKIKLKHVRDGQVVGTR